MPSYERLLRSSSCAVIYIPSEVLIHLDRILEVYLSELLTFYASGKLFIPGFSTTCEQHACSTHQMIPQLLIFLFS